VCVLRVTVFAADPIHMFGGGYAVRDHSRCIV
jgi:hypothetical protein